MEFERSIFRVHERVLKGPRVYTFLSQCQTLFFVLFVLNLVNLLLYHHHFVGRNDILKPMIEEQMKGYFYRQY